ncbi:MAG: hypothetical protein J6Y62_01680 [Clostridia bacterium]|nr:hypothetical protein [Clostridia bacterium]
MKRTMKREAPEWEEPVEGPWQDKYWEFIEKVKGLKQIGGEMDGFRITVVNHAVVTLSFKEEGPFEDPFFCRLEGQVDDDGEKTVSLSVRPLIGGGPEKAPFYKIELFSISPFLPTPSQSVVVMTLQGFKAMDEGIRDALKSVGFSPTTGHRMMRIEGERERLEFSYDLMGGICGRIWKGPADGDAEGWAVSFTVPLDKPERFKGELLKRISLACAGGVDSAVLARLSEEARAFLVEES